MSNQGRNNTKTIFGQQNAINSGKSIFAKNVGGANMFQSGTGMAVEDGNKQPYRDTNIINPNKVQIQNWASINKPSGKSIFEVSKNVNPIVNPTIPRSNTMTTNTNQVNPIFSGAGIFGSKPGINTNNTIQSFGDTNKTTSASGSIFENALRTMNMGNTTNTFNPTNIFGNKNELFNKEKPIMIDDMDMMDSDMDGININKIQNKEDTMFINSKGDFKSQPTTTVINTNKNKNSTSATISLNPISAPSKKANTVEEFEENIREKFGITRII